MRYVPAITGDDIELIEYMDLNELNWYVTEGLGDRPTFYTWAFFNQRKLFRILPYPYHRYGIAHDGIIFILDCAPLQKAMVPTTMIDVPESDVLNRMLGRTQVELVELCDIHGVKKSYPLIDVLAHAFLWNPKNKQYARYLTRITEDDYTSNEINITHFQNLEWI